MRTAAYDPSRNKKRSPKPRPKTLAVQSNGTAAKPCLATPADGPSSPRAESVAAKEEPESSAEVAGDNLGSREGSDADLSRVGGPLEAATPTASGLDELATVAVMGIILLSI